MFENITDVILEGYNSFLTANEELFRSPSTFVQNILSEDGAFNEFISSMIDGLPKHYRDAIMNVCERERVDLLNEVANNISGQGNAIAYAVMYFPILVDLFAQPVLTDAMTVYPIESPTVTIPRTILKAVIKELDGTTKEVNFPSGTKIIRPGLKTLNAPPNATVDLYGVAGISSNEARINRRQFYIWGAKIHENDGTNDYYYDTADGTLKSVIFRPNSRGAFTLEFSFTDSHGDDVIYRVTGTVDFDKGVVQYSAVRSGGTSPTYELEYIYIKVGFVPFTTDKGRVQIKLKNEALDVTLDVEDNFELLEEEENIQDWKAIYNIDVIRTLTNAIKTQLLLNRDGELAELLQMYESEMDSYGNKRVCDFSLFLTTGNFQPARVQDVYNALVPKIIHVANNILEVAHVWPQVILSNTKTATLLESLQDFAIRLSDQDHLRDQVGIQGKNIDFTKMTIVKSGFIPEGKLYITYRAPGTQLSQAAILALVYKPLYILEEIDNGRRRTYVRSRMAVEICRTDRLGFVELQNYATLI